MKYVHFNLYSESRNEMRSSLKDKVHCELQKEFYITSSSQVHLLAWTLPVVLFMTHTDDGVHFYILRF